MKFFPIRATLLVAATLALGLSACTSGPTNNKLQVAYSMGVVSPLEGSTWTGLKQFVLRDMKGYSYPQAFKVWAQYDGSTPEYIGQWNFMVTYLGTTINGLAIDFGPRSNTGAKELHLIVQAVGLPPDGQQHQGGNYLTVSYLLATP